ncbi:sulfurtransferase complex subunit TusD [Catenovulum sp. 2E275]|uniref:sulfurtransferase complex subunit TusD n=1 Tax=Catenovulum sp. 2E275 TaxID=2980497 RepID=UPI0021CEDDA8|nr:sulfurtransferase complex subunit TusD [Catenovulum sp. 2E275]MCU4677682.1 sulfurtransferase complex subunit TusD [Catenovulum sp. 2E275]
MTQFLLFITASADSQDSFNAYQFAKHLLEADKNQLKSVFFYGDAVQVANQLRTPPSDEFDLTHAWQQLVTEFNLNLIVCSAAAQRRGILDKAEAEYHGHQQFNLATGFTIGGLAEYVTLQAECEKVVQF